MDNYDQSSLMKRILESLRKKFLIIFFSLATCSILRMFVEYCLDFHIV